MPSRESLQKLSDLSTLENEIESSRKILREYLFYLNHYLEYRNNACAILSMKYPGPVLSTELIATYSLEDIINTFNSAIRCWREVKEKNDALDHEIQIYNKRVQEDFEKLKQLKIEQGKLIALSNEVARLETKITSEQKSISECEKAIDAFNKENEQLIQDAEHEKRVVEQNKKFVSAYNNFISRLSNYTKFLPLKNLAEINSLTLDIYNFINDGDRHFEKASALSLPTSVNDTITISFTDIPQKAHDVLHVLSEGHLRCLGLAILLAKNIHNDCPVVVFDDVVNAIDDDHRGGVRKIIFSYSKLKSKQLVLTTHAEQFIKELELHLNRQDYDSLVTTLHFVMDLDNRLIRIKHNSQRNYLKKIENACNDALWSEALYNCRCCLEALSHKLWRRLGKLSYKTEFAVVIRSPNEDPDLMSLVSSMNSFLKKIDDNKFKGITEIFDYLIAFQTSSNVIWSYLNKGSHEKEGRIDFDNVIVRETAVKLLELDKLVKAI